MTKKTTSSDNKHDKPRAPQADNGVKFTRLTAKQAQAASVRARVLRTQIRAQMLEKLVTELDFADEMKKAIVTGDLDRVNLLQTAMKVIGLHWDQSSEANKSKQITATATASTDGEKSDDNAANQTLKLQFEIVDPVQEDQEQAV